MEPQLPGQVLITKALIVSLAYYLVPMEKNIQKFIWSGRKG